MAVEDREYNRAAMDDCAANVQSYYPSVADITATTTCLVEMLRLFLEASSYPDDLKLVIRPRDVNDIAVRVLKRDEYYRFFHGIIISEAKRSALLAYWVVKLRPITIVDERYVSNGDAALVNERFAAFLLVCTSCIPLDDDEIVARTFNSGLFDKLVYSFRYRSLGIDEFIILSESLTPASFEQVLPLRAHRQASRCLGDMGELFKKIRDALLDLIVIGFIGAIFAKLVAWQELLDGIPVELIGAFYFSLGVAAFLGAAIWSPFAKLIERLHLSRRGKKLSEIEDSIELEKTRLTELKVEIDEAETELRAKRTLLDDGEGHAPSQLDVMNNIVDMFHSRVKGGEVKVVRVEEVSAQGQHVTARFASQVVGTISDEKYWKSVHLASMENIDEHKDDACE